MNQNSGTTKKVLIIVGAVLLAIGLQVAVFTFFMSLGSDSPKLSRNESLALLMPAAPKNTQLVTEGYDPKSHCFDKCGYLYRLYSYSDEAKICEELFTILPEGKKFTITFASTAQPPTVAWCKDIIRKPLSFKLDTKSPVVLKSGVSEDSRTIVSVVVSPKEKTIEYQVSEINEGIALAP